MLLSKNVSEYIKKKISGKSYSDKKNLQYVLELATLENYVRTGKVDVYFQGFTIDFFKDKYFNEYIELIKEIKGLEEGTKVEHNHIKKEKYLSKGIDFTYSGELVDGEKIWVSLGGIK